MLPLPAVNLYIFKSSLFPHVTIAVAVVGTLAILAFSPKTLDKIFKLGFAI